MGARLQTKWDIPIPQKKRLDILSRKCVLVGKSYNYDHGFRAGIRDDGTEMNSLPNKDKTKDFQVRDHERIV